MTMKGRIYAFEGGVPKKKTATTGKKNNVAEREPALFRVSAKVVNGGLTLEWATGNGADKLTPDEISRIKTQTGLKSLSGAKYIRALRIKQMMRSKTVGQMAKELKCSERTVWGIKSALLSSGGGG